jgi:hypothetical protein
VLDGLPFLDSRSAGDVRALTQLWHLLGFDALAWAWRRSRAEVGVLRWLEAVDFSFADGPYQHLLRPMDILDESTRCSSTKTSRWGSTT